MTSVDSIRHRKARHLDVCVDTSVQIESQHTFFDHVQLVHHPLPELDWDNLDTSTTCLGYKLARPFFISCMTGGSQAGVRINRHLVQAAQHCGIGVGLGSMRVLFKHPDLFDQFHVKPLAPDVPVWANLGAAQLLCTNLTELSTWLERLEVQSLVLHCNVGQELFQPQGDRQFTGILDAIRRYCKQSPVPVIVKETGFGLRPQDVTSLIEAGVAAIDIAGSGGTNWILVESHCHPERHNTAQDFADWGNSTAIVLAAMPEGDIPILASGGIRSGVDIAKSLALGADLAGLALPFIRAEAQGGLDSLIAKIESLTHSLKTAMLLTGSRTVADLHRAGLILSNDFIDTVRQYKHPEQWRNQLEP